MKYRYLGLIELLCVGADAATTLLATSSSGTTRGVVVVGLTVILLTGDSTRAALLTSAHSIMDKLS